MQFFIISSVICYIFFLFFLYRLGKEDFRLIRKNVALEQLFTITLKATLVGFLISRLVYVLFRFNTTYLNPLKFLVIFYFPGLNFLALFIGGYIYIWYVSHRQRLPSGRLIDFYTIAGAGIMPFITLTELFLPGMLLLLQLSIAAVYIFIFLLFRFLLLSRSNRGEIRDGTLGFLYISVLSTISFLQDAFLHTKGFLYFLQPDDIFYLLMLLGSIVIIYMSEFKQPKKRKMKM